MLRHITDIFVMCTSYNYYIVHTLQYKRVPTYFYFRRRVPVLFSCITYNCHGRWVTESEIGAFTLCGDKILSSLSSMIWSVIIVNLKSRYNTYLRSPQLYSATGRYTLTPYLVLIIVYSSFENVFLPRRPKPRIALFQPNLPNRTAWLLFFK